MVNFVLMTESLCQSPAEEEVFVLQYITVLPSHTVCDALTKTKATRNGWYASDRSVVSEQK